MINRRTFGQSISAVLAAFALPILAKTPEPRTVAELERWIEASFKCRESFPGAWCEVDAAGWPMPWQTTGVRPQPAGVDRVLHRVVGFGAEDSPDVEQKLVAATYAFMRGIVGDGERHLLWRRHPELSEAGEVVSYRDGGIYEEDAIPRDAVHPKWLREYDINPVRAQFGDDGVFDHRTLYLSHIIQPGMELDWLTRSWRHVESRKTIRKLSLRFALVGHDITGYVEDGAVYPAIA